jgi:hypothetical protein
MGPAVGEGEGILRMLKKHASPSMVLAVAALILALGGTAVGSVATISALSKKEKKQTRNIADSEVNKLAPGLSVAKAKSADTAGSATASNVFGATANDGGSITVATLSGTTVQKTSNVFRYTFPRSVQGCIPVASGTFDGDASALLAGTANPNSVDVTTGSGTGNSVIVLCP